MAFVDPLVGPSGSGNAWDTRRTFDAIQRQLNSGMVRVFTSTSDRDQAITAPKDGQVIYLNTGDGAEGLYSYSGTEWVPAGNTVDWVAWTPTLTNMTLGNGTQSGAYAQIGKTVFVRWQFTLGSTSTVGTDPEFSLPVTSVSVEQRSFTVYLQDTGVNAFYGIGVVFSGTPTRLRLQTINVAGTYPTAAQVTATVPHTWGNTDLMRVFGYYEAA